jgi:hypothetical protein
MYVCVWGGIDSIGEELQGAYRRALGGFARAVVTLDGLLSSPQYTQVPTSFDTPYGRQRDIHAIYFTRRVPRPTPYTTAIVPFHFLLAHQLLPLSCVCVCVVQLVSSLRQNQSKGLWALVAAWVRHTLPRLAHAQSSILATPGTHSHRHHARSCTVRPGSPCMPLDPPSSHIALLTFTTSMAVLQDERFVGGEGVGVSSGVEAVVVINLLLICRRLLQQVRPHFYRRGALDRKCQCRAV